VQQVQKQLFSWYESGKIKPHVMAEFPLQDYKQALQTVRDRRVVGKVVIRMRD
jgi:NADPH2:quinone reductase